MVGRARLAKSHHLACRPAEGPSLPAGVLAIRRTAGKIDLVGVPSDHAEPRIPHDRPVRTVGDCRRGKAHGA
jgi:hypothetical protein